MINLKKEIKKYISEIDRIKLYFVNKFHSTDTLHDVILGKIPKKGRIFDSGEYFFHGNGCHVEYDKKVIDFDYFSDNNGFKTIDYIKLYYFIQSITDIDENEFLREFEKLKQTGILTKGSNINQNLYLFSVD